MGKWMKRAAALMLAAMVVFGSAPRVHADPPSHEEDLENYANNNYDFLAGTSGYTRAYRSDYDPPFTALIEEDGGFYTDCVGYRIYDFDMDGGPELLIVTLQDDQDTGTQDVVTLNMYEWFSETPTRVAFYQMPCDQYYTALLPAVGAGGGYQPVIDVFAYTANGKVYICVESEMTAPAGADGRNMEFEAVSYSDDWSFQFEGSGHYAGSDGQYSQEYMNSLKNVGITGANWDDLFSQYTLIGHYAPNYQSIVRITQNPLVPESDLNAWMQYGNLMMRISRVDFSMPWQRKMAPIPNLDMVRMMLSGFSTWGGDYFEKDPVDWHEGELLAWAYNMMYLDIRGAASYYEMADSKVDLSINEFSYNSIGNGWYTIGQGQVENLVRSLAGFCPTYIWEQDFHYSDDFYAKDGTVYIRVTDDITTRPDLHLLIDSCYTENGYKFISGNVYQGDKVFWNEPENLWCIGRFTANISDTTFSIFGSELNSLVISSKPVYAANLVASASSSLPPEGGFSYGPELVLDGRTDTAWNEGAAGYGQYEWIQVSTNDGSVIPVTGLQVLSGYHKSQAVFDANGKPNMLSVAEDGKPWFLWNVYYDNVVSWGYVAELSSIRLTLSTTLPGTLYDDTCITEVRVLTADPYSQMPPYGTGNAWPSGTSSPQGGSSPQEQSGQQGESGQQGQSGNQSINSGDYILPESNTRLYTAAELAGLDKATLRLARNEIYARHGRRFNSADLQAYFDSKPWYHGTIAPGDFDNNVLNSFELGNIKLIESLE